MTIENEKRFYIDFQTIRMCYPKETSKRISDFGVLEPYRDNTYTLKEINAIIAEIITRNPYIEGSMVIRFNVMNGMGYHHILDIKNYRYKKQKRSEKEEIKYLY